MKRVYKGVCVMKGMLCAVGCALLLSAAPLFGEPGVSVSEGPAFGQPVTVPQLIQEEVVIVTASAEAPAATLTPVPESEPVAMFPGCELFECVKYKNVGKVPCCAVEKIVSVRKPCACQTACECNPCVCVKICVPPCNDCPTVKIRKCGDKVIYDYGKYKVEITTKKSEIVVAYHK